MYKKILEQMVQNYSIDFIKENFTNGINYYPGASKKLKVYTKKYSETVSSVYFNCEVMVYTGERYYNDSSISQHDFYEVEGIVHDTGKITVMKITKLFFGEVAKYNSEIHQLQFK